MSTKRKFTVEPPLLGLNGQPVRAVTLNIGTNPPGATGVPGAVGATGPAGNPGMILQSPNGTFYQIVVSDTGVLSTVIPG